MHDLRNLYAFKQGEKRIVAQKLTASQKIPVLISERGRGFCSSALHIPHCLGVLSVP